MSKKGAQVRVRVRIQVEKTHELLTLLGEIVLAHLEAKLALAELEPALLVGGLELTQVLERGVELGPASDRIRHIEERKTAY